MQRCRVLVLLGSFLVFSSEFGGVSALAATPSFTVSASNVTMPTSGLGSIPITLTSVNGYTGTIIADCAATNPPAGAKLPACGFATTEPQYTLNANAVVAGHIDLMAYPVPAPTSLLHSPGHGIVASMALASTLLLGLGFRRRAARWFALMLIAVGSLVGLAGIGACGGSSNTLTPGIWPYLVTATDTTGASVSTTVSVTVPPGIRTSL